MSGMTTARHDMADLVLESLQEMADHRTSSTPYSSVRIAFSIGTLKHLQQKTRYAEVQRVSWKDLVRRHQYT